jgi:hypothetical protein
VAGCWLVHSTPLEPRNSNFLQTPHLAAYTPPKNSHRLLSFRLNPVHDLATIRYIYHHTRSSFPLINTAPTLISSIKLATTRHDDTTPQHLHNCTLHTTRYSSPPLTHNDERREGSLVRRAPTRCTDSTNIECQCGEACCRQESGCRHSFFRLCHVRNQISFVPQTTLLILLCRVWIFFSSSVILFNKWILSTLNFRKSAPTPLSRNSFLTFSS